LLGTTLALVALGLGALVSRWWFLAAPLAGYACAWTGHFVFEKNRPATFRYPAWSLRADFRMWWYMLTGRMNAEVARALAQRTSGSAFRGYN
jgi:hypothetical protein